MGLALAGLEYENLLSALDTALARQLLIAGIYEALDEYWDATQEHQRGIAVGERARTALAQYPAERLRGEDGAYLMRVTEDLGRRFLLTKNFAQAEKSYHAALQSTLHGTPESEPQRKRWQATHYHNLGAVAQEQRQWPQAEHSYQQALALKIEFNDRYEQAKTYHMLGIVAQEQRQWQQAEQHFQQALALKIEFNDRYSQASTYGQLGLLAEEQGQLSQASAHLLQALAIFAEFGDEHSVGMTVRNLARLRTASGNESLAAAVAQVLGVSVEEVERRFESLRH